MSDVAQRMKRIRTVWIIAGIAVASLALVFLLPRQKSPAEVVRLSETLLATKVQAYYRSPNPTTLAEVKDAVADHRKTIERSELPPEAREAAERNLYEQVFIVRGIAKNDDLKL
jgi:hypothetical protein